MTESIVTDSGALDYRIYVHKNFSKADFDKWILDNLDLRKGLNVLDIGCGSGKHLFSIADEIGPEGQVVGADISDESLAKCKEKIKETNVQNIKVYKSDLTELKENLPSIGYDRALSSFAIYYTKDKEKTFSDIYDLLKPNGHLFICGPTPKNNTEFLELVKKSGGTYSQDFLKWTNFLEKDAKESLEKIFGNVEVTYLNNPIKFPTPDTVFKYWKATPHYRPELEEKMKDIIKEEFDKNNKFITNKVIIGLKCVKNE